MSVMNVNSLSCIFVMNYVVVSIFNSAFNLLNLSLMLLTHNPLDKSKWLDQNYCREKGEGIKYSKYGYQVTFLYILV